MHTVTGVLGRVPGEASVDETVELVPIQWQDAGKARGRHLGADGTDVAIAVARGTYLRHGDVLLRLDDRVLVVERPPVLALVMHPDSIAQAAAAGHAFGNQHVPLDIAGDELRAPITTSVAIATAKAEALEIRYDVYPVRLFADRPPPAAHAH